MRKRILFIMLVVISIWCLAYTGNAEARGMPAVDMNLIPTAETLGKGGYSFSVGMLPYNEAGETHTNMEVDVGGFFRERHDVKLKSDIWLVPSRITYGISERLDFTFGGTYSRGDTTKTITDYYEIGDEAKERVYSQPVFDGVLGMKYNIQKATTKLPAMSVCGEVQMGYTVDDEFVDKTIGDGFPFVAMQIYMLASYDFQIANVHGGLGMSISSKSVQAGKRFDLPVQLGAEIPFDGFAAVVDVALFKAFSGIGMTNIISGGVRYDISSRATLNVSAVSLGGLMVRLTVGGMKPEAVAPSQPAPTLF